MTPIMQQVNLEDLENKIVEALKKNGVQGVDNTEIIKNASVLDILNTINLEKQKGRGTHQNYEFLGGRTGSMNPTKIAAIQILYNKLVEEGTIKEESTINVNGIYNLSTKNAVAAMQKVAADLFNEISKEKLEIGKKPTKKIKITGEIEQRAGIDGLYGIETDTILKKVFAKVEEKKLDLSFEEERPPVIKEEIFEVEPIITKAKFDEAITDVANNLINGTGVPFDEIHSLLDEEKKVKLETLREIAIKNLIEAKGLYPDTKFVRPWYFLGLFGPKKEVEIKDAYKKQVEYVNSKLAEMEDAKKFVKITLNGVEYNVTIEMNMENKITFDELRAINADKIRIVGQKIE